jgi:hypothetical protein
VPKANKITKNIMQRRRDAEMQRILDINLSAAPFLCTSG